MWSSHAALLFVGLAAFFPAARGAFRQRHVHFQATGVIAKPLVHGLTSEQCPKGGALTLNAMGGIGMLAVGILGAPFIGYLQESSATKQLESANPALYQIVTVEKNYLLGAYKAIDPVKIATVSDDISKEQIQAATTTGQFNALGKMALFPIFMLACYLALIFYFKSKGGYKPVQLGEASAGGGK